MSSPDVSSRIFIPGLKQDASGIEALRARSAAASQSRDTAVSEASTSGSSRTVHDTVILSGNAQKIVNLNRGLELAADVKNAPANDGLAARLKTALEDIRRIGRLFGETLRSAFAVWR